MTDISTRPEPHSEAQIIRLIATTAMAFVLACALSACGRNDLKWTEDVRLPDGRVVTLERYTEFKGGSSQFGEPSTESLQRLEFKHPTTGEAVRWESTKERGYLETIALWLDKGTLVLLTQPAYGGDFRRLKCPNPPYLVYEFVRGQWQDKPLMQIGVEQLRSNMTTYVLERRQHIENNKRKLSADETSDSYTFRDGIRRVPYILDFKGMPQQTFDEQTCNYPSRTNNLLHSEGK
jgi:hypothetical protein